MVLNKNIEDIVRKRRKKREKKERKIFDLENMIKHLSSIKYPV